MNLISLCLQRNPPNSISVLWQLPQFTLLMVGEVLLAIPGIQFAFTQAPSSMKSVLTAAWFINNAFGNIIVVFITELKPFRRQVCWTLELNVKNALKLIIHLRVSFSLWNIFFTPD